MNRLKELRLKNGYKTQGELAKALFVNQTAVSQWERGVTLPSSQVLLKLSELYGESINYILGQADQKKEEPAPKDGDGLNAEQQELVTLFEAAPPALRAAALLEFTSILNRRLHGWVLPRMRFLLSCWSKGANCGKLTSISVWNRNRAMLSFVSGHAFFHKVIKLRIGVSVLPLSNDL